MLRRERVLNIVTERFGLGTKATSSLLALCCTLWVKAFWSCSKCLTLSTLRSKIFMMWLQDIDAEVERESAELDARSSINFGVKMRNANPPVLVGLGIREKTKTYLTYLSVL
jgi:hypothetical protein